MVTVTEAWAYRAIPQRWWLTAGLTSATARKDGRKVFTAVVLLAWSEVLDQQPEILGVPREELLTHVDTYMREGVWDALLADTDVIGAELDHILVLAAHQWVRQRSLAGNERMQQEKE
jgi:hypothetical protein